MNQKKINIEESEQNTTGLLKRIRVIRGFVCELDDININHLTFNQRAMFLNGFFFCMYRLLDEAEYILKNYTENINEHADDILSLSKDVTDLEHTLYELQKENKDLKDENIGLHKQVAILKNIEENG